MKTCLPILFSILTTLFAQAQIEHNKVLLTGIVSFTKAGDAEPNYEVGLTSGYFFSDRSMVGVAISKGKKTEFDLSLGLFGEMNTFTFSALYRNYISFRDNSNFYFIIQPSLNYLKLDGIDIFGDPVEGETTYVAVSPGFAFYPTRKIGLEFFMNGFIYELDRNDSESAFAFDLNPLSPSIGITFLLGNNRE